MRHCRGERRRGRGAQVSRSREHRSIFDDVRSGADSAVNGLEVGPLGEHLHCCCNPRPPPESGAPGAAAAPAGGAPPAGAGAGAPAVNCCCGTYAACCGSPVLQQQRAPRARARLHMPRVVLPAGYSAPGPCAAR